MGLGHVVWPKTGQPFSLYNLVEKRRVNRIVKVKHKYTEIETQV